MPSDKKIEEAPLVLRARVRFGGSICPSDLARSVTKSVDWRLLMAPVRQVAWRLYLGGRVVITQKGQPVGPERPQGPIHICSAR